MGEEGARCLSGCTGCRVPLPGSEDKRVLPLVAQPTKSMIAPKAVDDLTALLCAAPGA
jgi:hypothetical protein